MRHLNTCYYCGTTEDTRPYGPNGSGICFSCMKADPERESAASAVYLALFDANQAISPTGAVYIDGVNGPEPFYEEELNG